MFNLKHVHSSLTRLAQGLVHVKLPNGKWRHSDVSPLLIAGRFSVGDVVLVVAIEADVHLLANCRGAACLGTPLVDFVTPDQTVVVACWPVLAFVTH